MIEKTFRVLCTLVLCTSLQTCATYPTTQQVIDTMRLVNDHWINGHPNPGNNQWARAVYFEGNMAMYDVYSDQKYYDYAVNWAKLNNWELNGGDKTRRADNQCAGQTYLELYMYDPQYYRIKHIKANIDNMLKSTTDDDWNWIDAMQMAMPVFARLSAMFAEEGYSNKMWDLYHHTKYERGGHGLYSDNGYYAYGDHLWWRDANYVPPAKSPNGLMLYWSRGNGWVIAAHVRTLQYLSQNDPHRDEYIRTYQDMAATLKNRQRSDGFWNVNLGDTNHWGGKETSGTALFTYAVAWGINNAILDERLYKSVVEKAWSGMVNEAVHPDGHLGYVQGPARDPGGHQPISYEDTADFGVGAFLLAGSEVVKMTSGILPPKAISGKPFLHIEE